MSIPRARDGSPYAQSFRLPFDFPSETQHAIIPIYGCKGRSVRIDRVWLSLRADVPASASDFVQLALIKGASTIIARWTTATGVLGQGAIAAATPVDLVLTRTPADQYLIDGDVLSLLVDITGTITVPAGRLVAEGLEL